jgi:hypothetical protein
LLELAAAEARRIGESHFAAEHVLLGFLRAGEEASRGLAWFPYVGAVASQEEYKAVTVFTKSGLSIERLRSVICALPRRTLLRAADGIDSPLLRPATGAGTPDSLLRTAEEEIPDSASNRPDDETLTTNQLPD